MLRRSKWIFTVGAACCVAMLSAGCAIDLDLSSSPGSVSIGEPVTFDVKMTNINQCPVGDVQALILPFVPADLLIDQLVDDGDLAAFLHDVTQTFCTGGNLDIPAIDGFDCAIVAGELICTITDNSTTSMVGPPPETHETVAFETKSGTDRVTCQSDGWTITCRIPSPILEAHQSSASPGGSAAIIAPAVTCVDVDGFAICDTDILAPGEMAMGQIQLSPGQSGLLRNFGFAFASNGGGVCKTGAPGTPCSDDMNDDCPGNCGDGICSGGSNDGFGCDDNSECPGAGAECVLCEFREEDVLLGLACTTTGVGQRAPAMSSWGFAATILGLFAIASLGIHRARRRFR